MLRYKNLVLVGTSHISEKSIKQIEKAFFDENPGIIAVELDRGRLHALLNNEKPSYSPRLIKEIGLTGYLFAIIGGLLQKKLGSIVGVVPGSDMLRASTLARENARKLALIDQDVRITLRRLSKEFGFKEKLRVFWDVLASPFSKKLKIDLKDVPDEKVIRQILQIMKKNYPGLYKALISERNEFMATKIINIMQSHPDEKILAMVGAGHAEDMMEFIKQKMKVAQEFSQT